MKRLLPILAAMSLVFIVGCSKGEPKAVTPETEVNFGNVPVVTDMSQAKTKEFVIKNEGTGDLRLTGVQVKLLEGC